MKKLKKYLSDNGIAQNDVADALKCNPSTITRLVDGTTSDPAVSIAVKLERFTKGAIKCEDWVKNC